ncbi:MAG: Gx transporter family protein [Treponema sp.]|nr:Gx transporter family protein [Treponema sp.]
MSLSVEQKSPCRTNRIAFFAALCLFLSAVEYAIPKPLPFLRLGLANLPILLSLEIMRRRDTVLLVLLKVLGQGLISGTIFSYIFLFSAAGSFASGLTMLFLFATCKKFISAVGLSLAGALANTVAQIALARFILFGENVRYIAPFLLITGLITGFLLGLFAWQFKRKSRWYASFFVQTGGEIML